MRSRLAGHLGLFAACISVLVIAGCTSQSEPSPTPSYQTIDLVAADAEDQYPVSVRVVDESNRLTDARSASPSELAAEFRARPMEGAAIGVTPVDATDHSVLLIWNGSGCDRNAAILVAKDVSALTVDTDAPAACSLPGTYRGVVLTFANPVIVEEIRLEAK
jgi:hypothetical protein